MGGGHALKMVSFPTSPTRVLCHKQSRMMAVLLLFFFCLLQIIVFIILPTGLHHGSNLFLIFTPIFPIELGSFIVSWTIGVRIMKKWLKKQNNIISTTPFSVYLSTHLAVIGNIYIYIYIHTHTNTQLPYLYYLIFCVLQYIFMLFCCSGRIPRLSLIRHSLEYIFMFFLCVYIHTHIQLPIIRHKF